MKWQTLSIGASFVAGSAIALAGMPAHAFNFTKGIQIGSCDVLVDNFSISDSTAKLDNTLGTTTCTTADGFTLTTGDGYLQGKQVGQVSDTNKDKVKGVGVSGSSNDLVKGEIDKDEWLTATLETARKITSIDLSFMYGPGTQKPNGSYNAGAYADTVFEVAGITTDGSVTGKLTITGTDSAIWNLGGIVTNLSPSIKKRGGWYQILNPFGETFVSSLTFTAITQPGAPADSFKNSDYSLVGIKAAPVPEPGTVGALLGLGALGGLLSRRRSKA